MDLCKCDSRADADTHRIHIDVGEGVQSFCGQENVVVLGDRSGDQSGTSSLHGDGDSEVSADFQDRGDFRRIGGSDESAGDSAVAAGVIG